MEVSVLVVYVLRAGDACIYPQKTSPPGPKYIHLIHVMSHCTKTCILLGQLSQGTLSANFVRGHFSAPPTYIILLPSYGTRITNLYISQPTMNTMLDQSRNKVEVECTQRQIFLIFILMIVGVLCKWRVTLPATAGGSTAYTITATSDKSGEMVSLKDVLFGDVWLCSGQSNMQFTVPQVSVAHSYAMYLFPVNNCSCH